MLFSEQKLESFVVVFGGELTNMLSFTQCVLCKPLIVPVVKENYLSSQTSCVVFKYWNIILK